MTNQKTMNIKGTIKNIFATETVGASNFQKRKIWVEIDLDTKYPQTIEIELQGERTSLADSLNEGQVVDISINLRGREWTSPQGETKVFNTIVAWKVEVEGGQQSQPNAFTRPAETNVPTEDVSVGGEGIFDDGEQLPF
jgi:hypothetical protein